MLFVTRVTSCPTKTFFLKSRATGQQGSGQIWTNSCANKVSRGSVYVSFTLISSYSLYTSEKFDGYRLEVFRYKMRLQLRIVMYCNDNTVNLYYGFIFQK